MNHLQGHIAIQHETVAGRLRLRLGGLRGNAGLTARLNELAKGETAWFRAEVRDGIGSIILHHHPAASTGHLLDAVERIVAAARSGATRPVAETASLPVRR